MHKYYQNIDKMSIKQVIELDITNAIMDSELGRSAFTVERLTYTRTAEGTTSRSAIHQAMGCVHPGTPEMIQLLPEEERHEEFIAIYTDFALSLGVDHGSTYTGPDRIYWNGETWRVVRVRDWAMFGYCQAFAVRMNRGLSDLPGLPPVLC